MKIKEVKEIILFGSYERAEYLEKSKLLKMDVRYIGTDMEYSKLDIYETMRGYKAFLEEVAE